MIKLVIAIIYIAVMIIIGVVNARKLKTSEDFTVAGKSIPFWRNVNSIASMSIGAGATMGVASLVYSVGISGMCLGIGFALGGILAGLIFVKKIRESGEVTVPGLIRSKLGDKVANGISILVIIQIFSAVASQIRSLGIITQLFMPVSLTWACIIMTIIAVGYVSLGGMMATTKVDSVNLILMVLAIMVVMPYVSIKNTGGFTAMVANLPEYYFNPTTMGPVAMFALFLWITATGMTASDQILRIQGARNDKEAKRAMVVANLMVNFPYMCCCGLIGLAGAILIPDIGHSDSIIPSMIANYTSPVVGGLILAGLLAAVMGTTSGALMVTSVTFTDNVVKRINPSISGKKEIIVNRICIAVFAVLGIFVALNAGSIISIMEDIAAPAVSVTLPLYFAMFYWKKTTSKGALYALIVGSLATIGWWVYGLVAFGGSPFGIHHIIVGTIVSTIVLIIGSLATQENSKKTITE